ncbi:hypothetical protein AL036_20900 [Salipiger aestuarii]|uniref:hypothetical protein n=1 Tax=Salipiger aestuarii TaxID=568098 RepID=UPI00123AFABF|nr:hypothetical protein [Salipiger aestuarii]KAA8605065.1 hypothetical protein AL036_20900 [Salipiger aestuarii]
MPIVSLDHQSKRLKVGSYEVENQVVFGFFDKLQSNERDDALFKAINIGVLALMEDRLSSFLAKTSNHLGTELESLKMIFDMKQEIFLRSAAKGLIAEEEIADFLVSFFKDQKISDTVSLTGATKGSLGNNKTGDIVCEVDGRDDKRIVIESKFDKGLSLGDIRSKDIFASGADTAWSQLIEAQANREGKTAIIVFDVSSVSNAVLKAVQNVRFVSQIGFCVIVDSGKGDYTNLVIAYMLARDLVQHSSEVELDKDFLSLFVNRILKDLTDIQQVEKLVRSNIENNKKILQQLRKSMLAIEFTQGYLAKFLQDGILSKKDLLDYYAGDEVRAKFKEISLDV